MGAIHSRVVRRVVIFCSVDPPKKDKAEDYFTATVKQTTVYELVEIGSVVVHN